MIQIQQGVVHTSKLTQLFNKKSEVSMYIDRDAVKEDINRLLNIKNKRNGKSITNIVNQLNQLLSKVDENGEFEIVWLINNKALKAYPLELVYIPEYNIDMSDYILVKEKRKKLYRIDFSDVIKVIALDMLYRDIGETHDSIEEKLKDVGILGITPVSKLLHHFKDENILIDSRNLRVGDTPYLIDNKPTVQDYFGVQKFKSPYYFQVTQYSFKCALSIICDSIAEKLISMALDFSINSVNENGIYLTINGSSVDVKNILNESVEVRAFGRKFEVMPKITEF